MTDIRYIEVEVEDLRRLDEDGVVIFRERHTHQNEAPRRFAMAFEHDLMMYIQIARTHHGQRDIIMAHGAVMQFYEDHSGLRLDHVTIDRSDDDDHYKMVCHGTSPDGPFTRNTLPGDAVAMALFAGVPFWMEEYLFIQSWERSRDTMAIIDRLSPKAVFDPYDDLESIPDEDLPLQ